MPTRPMRMAVRYLFRTGGATFQGFFQAPDNAAVAMQVGVRLAATRVFNNLALFITDAVVKQDHLILFDWHRALYEGSKYAIITRGRADSSERCGRLALWITPGSLNRMNQN